MSPGGDGAREDDLYHVHSGISLVTHVSTEEWGGEEDLYPVHSGGGSVTHVPSGGWGRRGGSVPCTSWGTFGHTREQWEMGSGRGCHLCMQ